ncbi:hypothetical protein [Flavobacterium sp. H4147]|uniref:hypothetical protein n=1 Tax=Flavobacterium sp. H4147 TaxID=3034149 RepID=UPI0023ED5268|nr:hypothetical protein [Flavobacterium sp. H4147]
MEELNIDYILQNVVNYILSSDHVEKENLVFELQYSYDNYQQNLNDPYERQRDHDRYHKYILTDIKRFALLISVFETFVLPTLYLKSVLKQNLEIKELEIIQLEDFEPKITTKRPFNSLFSTYAFTDLGYLLFDDLFLESDFI